MLVSRSRELTKINPFPRSIEEEGQKYRGERKWEERGRGGRNERKNRMNTLKIKLHVMQREYTDENSKRC